MLTRYRVGSRLCTLLLPGRGQKANTFKIVVHIIYHQYKYGLKAPNKLNLRIQNGLILADFYTNRRIGKTNKNTRLTRAEYLEKCGERKNNQAREFWLLMKNNGWTRAGLARHLGFSRAWVSKVLNAEEKIRRF